VPQPDPPAEPIPRDIFTEVPTFDISMVNAVQLALGSGPDPGHLVKPTPESGPPYLGVVSFNAKVASGQASHLTVHGTPDFKSGLAVSSGGGALSTGNNGVYCQDVNVSNGINVGVGGVDIVHGSMVFRELGGMNEWHPWSSYGTAGPMNVYNETLGFRFTPLSDFVITQLWWTTESTFDPENPFQVGIWQEGVAEPIFQTTITNDEISMDGKWALKDVWTPILYTGQRYWIGGLLTQPNTVYSSGTPSWNALLIDQVVFGRNKGPVLTMPSPSETWCVGPVTFAARPTAVTMEVKNDGSILAKDVQLSGMPACSRGRTAGQSTGSGVDNTIHWNTAVYSGGGATTPNTDKIRVPVRGLYYVFYTISWGDVESGTRNSNIRVVGDDTHRYARLNIGPIPDGGQPVCLSASELVVLNANDDVYVEVYQDSGESITCMGEAASSRFGAICINRLPPP